jgi:hypothetical protein
MKRNIGPLIQVLNDVMENDSEENTIIAIKIYVDVIKGYKT